MPSPFPGLDPFIEVQDRWHSFHAAFIVACSNVLNRHLPPGFYATIEERVMVDATDRNDLSQRRILHRFGPDAAVVRKESFGGSTQRESSVATMTPRTLPQEVITFDQPTQKLVEIRGLPTRQLITTIELLSPSNKQSGQDRAAYLAKRADLLHNSVNLVDLDLLREGQRLPLLADLPGGDYHAFVTRHEFYSQCEVYSWTVREPLPTIAVPLKTEQLDVPLALQAAFDEVYENGRYSEMLMYEDASLLAKMPPTDREWAAALLPK